MTRELDAELLRALIDALAQAALEIDEAAAVFDGKGLPGLARVYRSAATRHRAAISKAEGRTP